MNKLTSGIYKIENKKTGQIYIGQSKNIEARVKRHCYVPLVDLDIAKYGEENFTFDILEEVEECDLQEREKFWIEGYGAYENDYHYNSTPGGHSRPSNLSTSKYTMWNTYFCSFNKSTMYKENEVGARPRKCFSCMYKRYPLPIGGFYDFLSCEIIGELIHTFIND